MNTVDCQGLLRCIPPPGVAAPRTSSMVLVASALLSPKAMSPGWGRSAKAKRPLAAERIALTLRPATTNEPKAFLILAMDAVSSTLMQGRSDTKQLGLLDRRSQTQHVK